MATAIIGGLLRESTVLADGAAVTAADLIGSAKTEATRQAKATQFGIAVTADNREVAAAADVLVLSPLRRDSRLNASPRCSGATRTP